VSFPERPAASYSSGREVRVGTLGAHLSDDELIWIKTVADKEDHNYPGKIALAKFFASRGVGRRLSVMRPRVHPIDGPSDAAAWHRGAKQRR